MSDTIKNNEGERFSFFQLFSSAGKENGKIYKLVIPIIQRDYAQGRQNERTEEVRDEFLDKLYSYLDEGNSHDLDFVYGTSEKSSNRPFFIPLDGQQRLTTLFLLHWYLVQRTEEEKDKLKFREALSQVQEFNGKSITQSMFSYMTRQSSSDFCDKLIGEDIDINKLIKVTTTNEKGKKKELPSLSETLKNSYWFVPSWNQDPTIQSMLVMLDAIHRRFDKADHTLFLKELLREDKPSISFIFMDLNEYNLTDDLYIKMNSRGKLLTPFENFKAKFEQYLSSIEKNHVFDDLQKTIKDKFNKKESIIQNIKQYFSFNIDTKWTNLFWAYCKEELKAYSEDDLEKYLENHLDKKIANFIRVIFTNQFAIDVINHRSDIFDEDALRTILLNSQKNNITFNQYIKAGIVTPAAANYLISALDILVNGNDKIKSLIPNSPYFDEQGVFLSVINDSLMTLTYPDRIRFHSYVQYLILFGKENVDYLEEWVRFIYNISDSDNTRTDSPEGFAEAVNSITNLLQNMKAEELPSILIYLRKQPRNFTMNHFSSWQVKEEIIKAHLLCNNSKMTRWRDSIIKLESDPYFNGQIGFILEFAGVIEYFDANGDCNWKEENDDVYFMNFERYGRIAKEIFKGGYDKRVYAEDAIFERAMLALYSHEYMLGNTEARANLLSSTEGGNVRRDFSWKRLLHVTECDVNRHNYVKRLFDMINLSNDLRVELQRIIKENTNERTWVDALVRYPENIKYCRSGFIYFQENRVMLLNGKNRSKSDAELFTYTLWKYKIEKIQQSDDLIDFQFSYKYNNSIDEFPYIQGSFLFSGKDYSIKISTIAEDWEFSNYEFVIYNKLSLNELIHPKCIDCLKSLRFKKRDGNFEEYFYISMAKNYFDDVVVDELNDICKKLKTLS